MSSSDYEKQRNQLELLRLAYEEIEVFVKRRAFLERVSPGVKLTLDPRQEGRALFLDSQVVPFLREELGLPRAEPILKVN
jgi:hypothetical protein